MDLIYGWILITQKEHYPLKISNENKIIARGMLTHHGLNAGVNKRCLPEKYGSQASDALHCQIQFYFLSVNIQA